MVLGNYCRNCGHRILPNEPLCPHCGFETGFHSNADNNILIPPIYDIGFFNLDIDFSPYIESKRSDFKYEICSCGYINEVNNEYCYMCGTKRVESRFSKILKNKSKPQFTMGNILCDCGTLNSKDNVYCEMCGKQLREDSNPSQDNYSNFNFEFEDPIFCFCGEENDKFSLFCKNCGRPLKNYGRSSKISILCACSTINEITSDYCIECGANIKIENTKVICVCGHKNNSGYKFCEMCRRPLNPSRVVKSKIICSCGEILDWGSDYCQYCGKNIKKSIFYKNSIKSIKNILR